MWAVGIGEVVASKSSTFAVGTKVTGLLNMQEYALIDAKAGMIRPYEEAIGLEHLSGLGVAGKAGYIGLLEIAHMQKGDVVLVSAAAGATGMTVSGTGNRSHEEKGGCGLTCRHHSGRSTSQSGWCVSRDWRGIQGKVRVCG